MYDDHIEKARFPADIKNDYADVARRRFIRGNRPNFCVASIIEGLAGKEIPGKGRMVLKNDRLFPDKPYAYVEFKPHPVMHFDQRLWDQMKSGNFDARFVGAHELGHVFQHSAFLHGFHGSRADFATTYGEECSAENQANQFAMFFLISDEDILIRHSETEISIDCAVPVEFVRKRIEFFEKMNRLKYAEWRSRSFEIGGSFSL